MKFMLLVGVGFWSTLTFVGIRKQIEAGGNALTEFLRGIHRSNPAFLLLAGITGLLAGVGLEIVEIVRITRMAGTIGGYAALGFVCAIVGAACLSAHLTLDGENSRT